MSDIRILPVLPLRDIVVFPHMVVPLFVGREKSVKALEEVMRGDKQILLATQRNSTDDDPQPGAIYDVGVIATVPVGRRPWNMAVTPDGKKLYVANGRSNSVSVIDTATNQKITDITVGELPWGVVIR